MRKNILLLVSIFVFSCNLAKAQNMQVVKFHELTNDLTANLQGTSKTDDNGEVAALIKIVTPETGFSFDGGSLGIVAVEQKAGEIWLYVPARAQRLTISHAAFGVLRNYTYEVPIEGARTYEMLLDIGTGCYANITATVAKSEVYIDNEYVGIAPIYNKYLNYGKHTIQGVNGKFEGTMELYATSDRKSLNIDIEMADMSSLYGDLRVIVDNNADIYFGGKKVASGLWDTQMKAGNYVLETKKADHEDAKTSFTVVAQEKNQVTAIAPSPYTGYLRIYTRPLSVSIIDTKGRYIDLSEQTPLLVGSHQFQFRRKGYIPQTHEYTIARNQVQNDTIELQRITYFKKAAFYAGAALSAQSLIGVTGIVGTTLWNNDLQFSYTLGLAQSKAINIYDTNWNYIGSQRYRVSTMSVKYGYQINVTRRIALTPQVGFSFSTLSSKLVDGSQKFADGATCKFVPVGVKLLWVPVKHLYLFAAPEYGIAINKDESFKQIASETSITAGGFSALIGFTAYF